MKQTSLFNTPPKPLKKKKCKVCKTEFIPLRPLQYVCTPYCASQLATDAAIKKRNQEWRKEKIVIKEKIKKLGEWKEDLQKEINHIARLVDHLQPCIASGISGGKMNGGHYISVAASATIRYNLHNVHIQAFESNHYKSGDTIRYQDGLKRIYGLDYFNYVESLRQTKPINLTIEDIKTILPIAREIKKELIKADKTYSPSERIELRTKYNKQLGIYDI